MSDTKFAICSRAAVSVGCKQIASFSDGTTESAVAAEVYDARVRELLGEHDWRFAVTTIDLSHLADAPDDPWTHAWQLPADMVKLLSLYTGGERLTAFEQQADRIVCDVDENSTLTLTYVQQKAESFFPPWFTRVLEHQLAADFAGGVSEDAGMVDLHRRAREQKLMLAKRLDRLQQPARRLPVGRLRAARR